LCEDTIGHWYKTKAWYLDYRRIASLYKIYEILSQVVGIVMNVMLTSPFLTI